MTLEVREITPHGLGAVSIVRVRGSDARATVERIASGTNTSVGSLKLVNLALDGELVDRALVAVLSHDEVEVCLHGSPKLVQRVVDHLRKGSEHAIARTMEERASELCASAPSESAARILLDQAAGALRGEITNLPNLTTDARIMAIDALAARGRHAHFALVPARVVLAGPVNAGKSTLFNALLGRRGALVSDAPGTTRDVVWARARFGEYPVLLADTAGERALDPHPGGQAAVEQAGQEHGRRARGSADLVFWLTPARERTPVSPPEDERRVIRLTSQADRLDPDDGCSVENALSARDDSAGACELVIRLFHRHFDLPDSPWIPGSAVPFDPELVRDIVALRDLRSSALLASALARVLAPS